MVLIYSCLDHVELALEKVIDETLQAPVMDEVPKERQLSTRCEYCDRPAIYVVSNSYSHTECGQ